MMTHRVNSRVKHAMGLMGVWYAIMLHSLWAGLLFTSTGSLNATALHGPSNLFPNPKGLAILMVVVAGCALVGIYMDRVNITKVMLLVPQQIMLGLSAFSAIQAMYFAHFADGVERSRAFIMADQAPAVFALIIHSATIVYLALVYERSATVK